MTKRTIDAAIARAKVALGRLESRCRWCAAWLKMCFHGHYKVLQAHEDRCSRETPGGRRYFKRHGFFDLSARKVTMAALPTEPRYVAKDRYVKADT